MIDKVKSAASKVFRTIADEVKVPTDSPEGDKQLIYSLLEKEMQDSRMPLSPTTQDNAPEGSTHQVPVDYKVVLPASKADRWDKSDHLHRLEDELRNGMIETIAKQHCYYAGKLTVRVSVDRNLTGAVPQVTSSFNVYDARIGEDNEDELTAIFSAPGVSVNSGAKRFEKGTETLNVLPCVIGRANRAEPANLQIFPLPDSSDRDKALFKAISRRQIRVQRDPNVEKGFLIENVGQGTVQLDGAELPPKEIRPLKDGAKVVLGDIVNLEFIIP